MHTCNMDGYGFFHKIAMVICVLFFCSIVPLVAAGVVEQPSDQEPRMVTDMRGRSVAIPPHIDGIIALEANSLRLLTYFQSIGKVIAVEDSGHAREKTPYQFFNLATYRIAYPGLRNLPDIGSSSNHEGIIAAAPDIIFSSTVDVGQLDQLQQTLGIPVFAINADVELNNPQLFLEQLRLVGNVLGEDERAEELVAGIEAILADLSAHKAKVTQPERAYAGGVMFYGPADLLRTTGDYDPFDFTGTQNVMPSNPTGNRQPYMTSIEDLIGANPDHIFVDSANHALSQAGYMASKATLDEHVAAFKHRNVYTTLVYKYYGTNWESQIINIYYVGKVLYPQLYADVSIEEKAEEIWQLFFRVPLEYQTVVALQSPAFGRALWF